MGFSPGRTPERETPPQKEGPIHAQYSFETVGTVSYLKYCGEPLLAKLRIPRHRQSDLLQDTVAATSFLLPAGHEDKGGITFAATPAKPANYLEKMAQLTTKKNQKQARVKKIMVAQTLRLAGYKHGSKEETLLRGTLEASKFFDKGIYMKIGSFFLELFKIEKKHAIKDKVVGRHDSIVESAGVYPIIRKIQAPDGFVEGRSDPIEVGVAHGISSILAGTLQYAKDLSSQGGLHPDANRDPHLNALDIQSGAKAFFSHVRENGFASLFKANHTFIKDFDKKLRESDQAQANLNSPSRCLVTPNVELIPDGKTVGEFRFHAEDPILSPDLASLQQIQVAVFNHTHTHYQMLSVAELGSFHIDDITKYLIKNDSPDPNSPWKTIDQLESDSIRPVFALSVTKNGETPRGLIDNAGLNGETLIHYDFRVNDDGTVDCITHHGHTRQDGGIAAVYSDLQRAILPPIIPDSSSTVMELATLYPVKETPQNGKELLNSLGFSDLAVGEGYNQQELKEYLKTINEWYNESFSQHIFDTVSLELQDNTNIDAFIASLAAEHPQVERRQNLYSHKLKTPNIEIPPAADELELLLDNLLAIKLDPTSPEAQKLIKKTASLVRNLLSPNISEVHLFDMVLAARGGVVNCTLPLFNYLRLETSIVKGNRATVPLIAEYQKLQNEPAKKVFVAKHHDIISLLFADLEVNLLDQTLSRLGLPPAGFLLEQAGAAADQVAELGKRFTPGAVPISRHVYVQTSFIAGLGKFISALQRDMPEQNLAISGTDDGKGHGYLCYRVNLAKPESQNLLLNMLDCNAVLTQYLATRLSGSHRQIQARIALDTIAFIGRLKITEAEKSNGVTLNTKLDLLSKQNLDAGQKQVLKDILTLALQHDLHQTITRTQALAEMLALYSQSAPR